MHQNNKPEEKHLQTIAGEMPLGFSCCGVNCGMKEEMEDLGVFFSSCDAAAAGVFTKNLFPGAPVVLGREIIKKGVLRAIVVNSRVSNVGTGETGITNARIMAKACAEEFGISEDLVIMSSTGVIAKQLPIEKIRQGIQGISRKMGKDPLPAVRGMMTTDTYPKVITVQMDNFRITVCGKGAGMIEPNMATMLVYFFTDAKISAGVLDTMLKKAVSVSFNMLSVDTDTSTSDTCLILANGMAKEVDHDHFYDALEHTAIEMTRMLARDAEGATKLLTANVTHAKDTSEARYIAKSIINSPLVKTMAYGADPNIGRILMAVGKCFDKTICPDKTTIFINGVNVFGNGEKTIFDETALRKILSGDPVEIRVDLGCGEGEATAWGCDLTEGYIRENASYYSS